MHRFLAAFLGILAFLMVCLYWLWQILAGEAALPLEDVALRAVGAMLAVGLVGWLLGRIVVALMSEAWHESRARALDRSEQRMIFGGGKDQKEAGRPGAASASGPGASGRARQTR